MKAQKIKQIYQNENSDCGLACLAMVLNTLGSSLEVGDLRKKYDTNLKGMSINQMLSISGDYGVNARVVSLEAEDVKKLGHPTILHWELTHYVVLNKVSKNYVYINDPELGVVKYSKREFSGKFSGIAIEFSATPDFKKVKSVKLLSLRNITSTIDSFKKKLVLLVVTTLVTQVFVLFFPYYSKVMIDKIIIGSELDLFIYVPVIFLIALTMFQVINYIKNIYLIRFSHSIGYDLSRNIFIKLMSLPVDYFEKRNSGDIVSRFDSVSDIKIIVSEDFVKGIINAATIFVVFFMLITYQIVLILPLVLSLLAIVLSMAILQPRYESYLQSTIIKEADANNEIIESIRGIQVIKLFGIENNRINIWANKFIYYMNNLFSLNKHRYIQDAIKQYAYNIESILSIIIAVILIMNQQLTLGGLFAFMLYKNIFTEATTSALELYFKFKSTKIHVHRVADIISADIDRTKDSSPFLAKSGSSAKITFSNVSFSYSRNEEPVVKNMSFEVDEGKTVVLTGESGSGKTTLFKLMAGILKGYDGEIYIDGRNIKSLDFSLGKHIGFVMQNDKMFTGSIADNIALFESDVDLEKVKRVCEIANISKVIDMLPMGYFTMINELGSIFSSGQLQRLLIARALYNEPAILVLDEGTANLDPKNEEIILTNLAKLDITVLHAAHNNIVKDYADQTIVLTS